MHISRRKLKDRRRRAGEGQATGVTGNLARAVRLKGVSRSSQPGTQKHFRNTMVGTGPDKTISNQEVKRKRQCKK